MHKLIELWSVAPGSTNRTSDVISNLIHINQWFPTQGPPKTTWGPLSFEHSEPLLLMSTHCPYSKKKKERQKRKKKRKWSYMLMIYSDDFFLMIDLLKDGTQPESNIHGDNLTFEGIYQHGFSLGWSTGLHSASPLSSHPSQFEIIRAGKNTQNLIKSRWPNFPQAL